MIRFTDEDWEFIARSLSVASNWYFEMSEDSSNEWKKKFREDSEKAKEFYKYIRNVLAERRRLQ